MKLHARPILAALLGCAALAAVMPALSTPATTSQVSSRRDGKQVSFEGLTAADKLLQGVLWARNSSGYIINASDTAGMKVVGLGFAEVDNSAGAAGDMDCVAERGIFLLVNSGTNALTRAHIGQPCYVEDNITVASKSTNGVVAGVVEDVTSAGVWVNVGVSPLEGIARRRNVVVATADRTLAASESGACVSNAAPQAQSPLPSLQPP